MGTTLEALFNQRCNDYERKLMGIKKTNSKEFSAEVIDIVYQELSSYFEYGSDYRNGLTGAESAMLTSMLQFFYPQKDVMEMVNMADDNKDVIHGSGEQNAMEGKIKWILSLASSIGAGVFKLDPFLQIIATAAGFTGGSFIEKILPSKLHMKLKGASKKENKIFRLTQEEVTQIKNFTKDILCKIDVSMDCFRIQLSKTKESAEVKKKPFEKEYEGLLNKIQVVLGIINYVDEKLDEDILFAVKSLEKSLLNLDISTVYYNESMDETKVQELFETFNDNSIDKINPVYPAFVKKEVILIKGRIDVPK